MRSETIMSICNERLPKNCWGCPFKAKAGRSTSCMEWIDAHEIEALDMAELYIKNGHCLYNRAKKPYVGKLPNNKWQQVCRRCDAVVVLDRRDIVFDDYVEEYQYDCPVCHLTQSLRPQKRKERKGA